MLAWVMYLRFVLDLLYLTGYTLWLWLGSLGRVFVPRKPKSLKGEVVLVTGGGNGIGRELCLAVARREKSLTMVVWDVDEVGIAKVVAELEGLGVTKVLGRKVDVSDRVEVQNAAKEVLASVGDVTLLFNNAGIACEVKPAWEMSPERTEKLFGVNLVAHCWTLRELLPGMIRNDKGHVVVTCSVLGLVCGEYASSYIASKHGVKAYTECVKEDLRKLANEPRVRFTTVYPNHTQTQMMANIDVTVKYPFMTPISSPAEVAERVVRGVLVNEEHIYFPNFFRFLPFALGLLPPAALRKAMDMMGVVVHSKDV